MFYGHYALLLFRLIVDHKYQAYQTNPDDKTRIEKFNNYEKYTGTNTLKFFNQTGT